ncbi:MAG: hypothetical protein K1X54_09325 [Flavobacteriales bacterium]|nr:hypothetical protein [Flavobacteriales bacterium]
MKLYKIILPLVLLAPFVADAQCRAFTKNQCLPQLDGYIQNDNYNSAMLVPGDEAELLLTFYGGKEYRLVVCAHPILGSVDFEITDTGGESIYKGNSAENGVFDFKMTSTQQLIVKLRVPEQKSSVSTHEGCVSVMAGSKELN